MSQSEEPATDRTIGREGVLLIEDDPQFAHQFATFLASQGYDVDVVPTAAEMFQKLEENTYDCLIVDLTPAEFNLLWVLAQADGRVLSRYGLVDAVSNGDGPASTRAVDILVSRIRKKLQRDVILPWVTPSSPGTAVFLD